MVQKLSGDIVDYLGAFQVAGAFVEWKKDFGKVEGKKVI